MNRGGKKVGIMVRACCRSVEEHASGWVDIALAPAPGAFKAQRAPQAGAIIILTNQRPPPRQALDWLAAGDGAAQPGRRRAPSPAMASRRGTPEPQDPASLIRRASGSRSPSPRAPRRCRRRAACGREEQARGHERPAARGPGAGASG